jgi:4-hydroxy-tetrahydrodipicolinate synthase
MPAVTSNSTKEYAAMPSGRLQGIFTPNLVPHGPNGEINEPELRRYVDWLIDKGVHGLYPNGSTGEFTRFTPEERRRIVAVIADQNRGRVPILAGAAEANVKETLAACEYYASLGVRAVAIVAPFYYKLSPASVYAYFREIGRNTPVDVTLYNIPMFASPIDVPTVRRLSEECERIVAIKDSSGDIPHMIRMIQAVRPNRPEFSFLTGWDAALMPMLLIGCDGGTNASSGVVPEMTRKLYDLTLGGRLDEARRLQYDLVTLFDTMIYSAEFPEGFRAAVELRGFRMGRGRQPLSDEQQTDLATLSNTLQCLLAAHGFTDEPIGGCPTDGDGVDPAEVGRIVQDVVAELQRRGMI